jgi:hypothetical protein
MLPAKPSVYTDHQIIELKAHIGIELCLEEYYYIQYRRQKAIDPQADFLFNAKI